MLTNYIIAGPSGKPMSTAAAAKMDDLVDALTADVFELPTGLQEATIMLTGSTGTFGSQILAALLPDSSVAKVLCLNRRNRSRNIWERQREHMDDPTVLEKYLEKVEFAEFDPSKNGLGLSRIVQEEVSLPF